MSEKANEPIVFLYHGKSYWSRQLTSLELAEISCYWENPTVDTRYYYQNVVQAWETEEAFYKIYKADGGLCQKYNGKFYIA